MKKPTFWQKKGGIRLLLAAVVLLGFGAVLDYVHDYPQTKEQIDLIRLGDDVAVAYPWIVIGHFLNEAGSGIKYHLTNNPKYMRDYPSKEYQEEKYRNYFDKLNAAAHNNDWSAQLELARVYYTGEGELLSKTTALFWLHAARTNAPDYKHAILDRLIMEVEEEQQSLTNPVLTH